MKLVWIYGGPLLFLIILLNHASHFGRRWELGRFAVPRSLTSADGRAYADGTATDPLTGILIRSGNEELFLLILLFFVIVCVFGIILILRDTAKKRLQLKRWQALIQSANRHT